MELLTEREAAKMLTISVETIRAWRKLGKGPIYQKIGRSVRYRTDMIEQFVEDGKVDPREV